MPEPNLITRERVALRDLLALTADRARAESNLTSTFSARKSAIDRAAKQRRSEVETRYRTDKAAAAAALVQVREEVPARLQAATAEAQARFEAEDKNTLDQYKADKLQVETEHNQTRWEAATVFEAGKGTAEATLKDRTNRIDAETDELDALNDATDQFLSSGRMRALREVVEYSGSSEAVLDDPIAALTESNDRAADQLAELQRLRLPKLLREGLGILIGIVILIAISIPAFIFMPAKVAAILSAVGTIGLGLGVNVALFLAARKQVAAAFPALDRTLARSQWLIDRGREWAAEKDRRAHEENKERQLQGVRKADRRAAARNDEVDAARRVEMERGAADQARTLEAIRSQHEHELRVAEQAALERIDAVEARFRDETRTLEAKDQEARAQFQEESSRAWSELAERWRAGVGRWHAETQALKTESGRWFLDWSDPAARWRPPSDVAPAMRFGRFEVDRARLPGGLPRDERLKDDAPERESLPALLPFPEEHGSLVVRVNGESRSPAVALIQAMMLRFLTSAPAGKVRFTIVDPVGLGQNFAAFMHLADYDEQLVTSRIWTEPQHIERKLAELTEHMEKVIQKYLRNEYQSIQEYNAIAGEVAEPFRVLVVANFPANFTEQAARRLVSIAQSGPKCGVYVLLSGDPRESPPPGCTLADLEKPSTVLTWREGRFVWLDPDFGGFPLELDAPPADEPLTRLLHEVGGAAKDASRVEVPFEVVAPRPEEYWTEDTSDGIDIPLGRVGATKFQYMRLGKGTSQHVLLAGRTGSGKSTLLHALITNAALRYSPDQVEMYLIDFKKGVEFKTYAANQLPHARVIAIESEREFGLSVLQRLDAELKDRGEAFRAVGVQDLAGYRASPGSKPMPRVMLIVDEFQEFFVDDDKLAQEAALLLDRLVRQGRAFGIHVLLGSQTLGGAFSLARSTLGQMAVRIALQCSESDAHLILSEDNGAARLLSRPGEAIYNDANGMLEGNHFFQVVWLGDDRRDSYLNQIAMLERQHARETARPQLVFEGNIPADITKNHLLATAINGPDPVRMPRAPLVWFGDAVAIKGPTAATLRRQSGGNVLVVGQNDEAALGMALSALVSLAAQFPSGGGAEAGAAAPLRCFVLDGTPDDAPLDGVIAAHAGGFPQPIRVVGWRDTADVLNEIAEEVARRQADRAFDEGLIALIVHDLARFRDLRKSDDDFGFGMSRGGDSDRPSPSKQFTEILRDGPGVGVHVIAWCDSFNNLNRSLDRQSLREFEMRVLFQMSSNDSSALIDNPVAGRLGTNRAFFASEEEGRLEKFRPYGLPSKAWWNQARDRLQGRGRAAGVEAGA